MAIDDKVRKEIVKKAELFVHKGDQIKKVIEKEINVLIKRLEETKIELIEEVENEFNKNIYADLLVNIESDDSLTNDEVKSILSKEIPNNFGPTVSSFISLRKEIDSLRLWREKKIEESKLNSFDLIPKNLIFTSTTYDSISIRWDKVDCECYYEIELKSLSLPSLKERRVSLKTEYTFSELNSGSKYQIRVRAIALKININCIWSDPITVKIENKIIDCAWKECPADVYWYKKYSIDKSNPRIATKIDERKNDYCYGTVLGNTPLPFNKIISWNIKILKSINNGWGYYRSCTV